MGDQASVQRRTRWLIGCGIAAGIVMVMVIVPTIGFVVLMKPKHAETIGALSSGASEPEYKAAMGGPPPGAPGVTAEMVGGPGPPGGAPAEGGSWAGQEQGQPSPFLTSVAEAGEIRRDIIYTADLRVEVDDIDAAAAKVEQTVRTAGGWLGGKTAHVNPNGDKTTSITARVPSTKFDAVMADLRTLGDVRSENIKAEDVTRQMVDLEARLKNLRREEEVVAELFKRQGKITDVLQVEQQLARVRGEIEQTQGQLSYLRESARYSTITIGLSTKPSEVVQKLNEWNLGYHVTRAWHALVTVLRGLTYAVIYVGIVAGPFIAIPLLIWYAIRSSRRRKATAPPGGPAQ